MGPNRFAARRRLPVVLAVAAAGAAVGLARRRRSHPAGPLPVTGRVARGAGVARLAGRVGRSYASTGARQIFASAARKEELQAEQQLKTAADVVAALGNMKGALMKIGQMASYLDTGLPEPVREALAGLQQDAPPMSPELAAQVIAEEFGKGPEAVFAEWDPEPIAAASIGQVHRALTHDGQAVAVKVQYPGVDDAIRSDLDNTGLLLQMTSMAFPGLDAGPVVEELRARVLEELDYFQEARNQQRFADFYATHPFIHIPSVRADLSTGRVLTTELVNGTRYSDVLQWPAEERDLAGEAIFRFVFGCLYRTRAFNGDPHPGNYIFHGGGRVTILDFGLVKWFSDSDVDLLAEMVKTLVVHRDIHAFRGAVERAGFLKPDPALTDDQIAAYFDHYYELVLGGGRKAFSVEYASETLRTFFDASNEVVKRANVPAPFVILQRINLGLYAVLAGLGATADWRRVAEEIWPFVDAPPSTELGRQEAAWHQQLVDQRGTTRISRG
jgi:predicted unusual protein kinase regulating ubiquinone biosynthesis (AarF/ABC1/UbiB family)